MTLKATPDTCVVLVAGDSLWPQSISSRIELEEGRDPFAIKAIPHIGVASALIDAVMAHRSAGEVVLVYASSPEHLGGIEAADIGVVPSTAPDVLRSWNFVFVCARANMCLFAFMFTFLWVCVWLVGCVCAWILYSVLLLVWCNVFDLGFVSQ